MSSQPDRRLVWIADIPTPYRSHQYEAIAVELRSRGVDFEVMFMAESVPWRSWPFEPTKMHFPFRVAPGIHPSIGPLVLHVNPSIPWSVLTNPPTWLLLGGGWFMPTAVLAMAAGMSRQCRLILGAEANRHSTRYHSGPIARVRREIMNRADAFLVPGQVAREAIEEICVGTTKPFLPLPNLVDESVYQAKVAALRPQRAELRRKAGLADTDLVLLWTARLVEEKGILRFLEAVQPSVTARVKILIAGDGPERQLIERWLAQHLPHSVRLLGTQSTDQMAELFAIADAAILPSIRDANPLAVVEALWAGLPLLISERCGNRPEAVVDGQNGWAVDPYQPEMVRAKFSDLINRSRPELEAWGALSAKIAVERFSTPRAVSAFADSLETLLH